MDKKRIRGLNTGMTAPEKELLSDLCVKFSNVIDCKKTDGATRLSKVAAISLSWHTSSKRTLRL